MTEDLLYFYAILVSIILYIIVSPIKVSRLCSCGDKIISLKINKNDWRPF